MKWLLNIRNIEVTNDEYIVIFISILIFILGILNLYWCNKTVQEDKNYLIKSDLSKEKIFSYLESSKKFILIEGVILIITMLFYVIFKNNYWLLGNVFLSLIVDFILYMRVRKHSQLIQSTDLDKITENQEFIQDDTDRKEATTFIVITAFETLYGVLYCLFID